MWPQKSLFSWQKEYVVEWRLQIKGSDIQQHQSIHNLLKRFLEFAELSPLSCFWLIICSDSTRGGHLGNKAPPLKHAYWYDNAEKRSCTLLEAIVVPPVVLSLPLVMAKLITSKFARTSGTKDTSEMGKGSRACCSLISVHWSWHGKEMPILELDILPV